MRCAWKELISILPQRLRNEVDLAGKETLNELRLRINAPPEMVCKDRTIWMNDIVTEEDLTFLINAATHYSPWAGTTSSQGYITANGGHRIGLCGEVVFKNGFVTGMRSLRSVCIRVARDYPGIGGRAANLDSSLLILGAPGTGKTTLLRDLIRQIAARHHVAVIDERCELFPEGFEEGILQDTIRGCTKPQGIERMLRTMGPEYIAVDEVTAESDAQSLIQAGNYGVKLLATAHAGSLEDYRQNRIYKQMQGAKLFQNVLVLDKRKNYTVERMNG